MNGDLVRDLAYRLRDTDRTLSLDQARHKAEDVVDEIKGWLRDQALVLTPDGVDEWWYCDEDVG